MDPEALVHPAPVGVDSLLARIDNLPTLSAVAMRVGELVNDPRASARHIAEVLRQDPSLSAKVLRLVNSSYYAIPGGVSDVMRAVSFIGFNTLHQLVLSISVLSTLRAPDGTTVDARALWRHALAVGCCAEVLARRIGHKDPSTCFTAGLLHDVGKIALAIAEPSRYHEALASLRAGVADAETAEIAVGLPSHTVVGSRLGRRWKFPAQLLVGIEHHHAAGTERVRREVAPSLIGVADIIRLADEICTYEGEGSGKTIERVDPDALMRLNLGTLAIDDVHGDTMRRLEQSKVFLDLVG